MTTPRERFIELLQRDILAPTRLPADQRGDADSLWRQRVLLQPDPDPLARLMNHLLAALPAAPNR